MSQNNPFTIENIAEFAEHLTLDEAKDSPAVPLAVGPTFTSEELTNTITISKSLKARIECLEKAVYLLIRNNIDSTKLNCNRDTRFESILQELRDIKNDFVQGK